MASRSSCSSPLGERTASGFSRVNMMKVGMALPPMLGRQNTEVQTADFDFNQIDG
jgi:hypothetical protein